MTDNLAVINADARPSALGWSVIAGGAVVAAAILFLLLAFGTSVGLSVVSPWGGRGASAQTLGILTALWFLISAAASFWIGGYLAGRLRLGWEDLSPADSKSRDGFHGLVVWAFGITIFTALAIGGTSVAAGGGKAAEITEPHEYVLDTLFRGEAISASTESAHVAHRAEAARILARSMGAKPLPAEDKNYLARIVANDTSATREEAVERVQAAIVSTKEVTDAARKATIFAGFLTVSGLFIAAAAAWTGAIHGGKHAFLRGGRR